RDWWPLIHSGQRPDTQGVRPNAERCTSVGLVRARLDDLEGGGGQLGGQVGAEDVEDADAGGRAVLQGRDEGRVAGDDLALGVDGDDLDVEGQAPAADV